MWGLRQTNREDWKSWKTQIKYRFLRSMATRKRWRLTYAVIMVCYRQYTKLRSGGGCWFCPNMRPCQVRNIRDNHPELWIKLLELEKEENLIGNIWNTLKKISVWELEEQYFWEEAQMTVYDFLGGGEAGKSQNDG